ncbi:MAG: hypothetical protein ACUVTL_09140 [Thermoproteota archaeon]
MIENGPVMARIRVEHGAQDIIVYKGIRRVDFVTHLEWKELANEEIESPMLIVSFSHC